MFDGLAMTAAALLAEHDKRNPCPKCLTRCYMPRCYVCNAYIPANDRGDSGGPKTAAEQEQTACERMALGFRSPRDDREVAKWLAEAPRLVVAPDEFGRSIDIPTTYPDGSGSLTPYEWVAWAKRELLYGTNPPPKKD